MGGRREEGGRVKLSPYKGITNGMGKECGFKVYYYGLRFCEGEVGESGEGDLPLPLSLPP